MIDAAAIPFDLSDMVMLRLCRCLECKEHYVDLVWSPDGKAHRCRVGIGGSGVVWSSGTLVTEPAMDNWHYCYGYAGPSLSKDVLLWPKVQDRQSLQTHQQAAPLLNRRYVGGQIGHVMPAQRETECADARTGVVIGHGRNSRGLFDSLAPVQDAKVKA